MLIILSFLNSQQKIHIYANGPLENEETVLKAEKELFDDFTPPKPPIVIDS